MFFHVGYFLKKYMDILEINVSKLATSSGVSKTQLANILNYNSGISAEIAIKIAPFLNVNAGLLINLHTLWLEDQKKLEFNNKFNHSLKNVDKNFYKKLSNLNSLSIDRFDSFKNNYEVYTNNLRINHYMPSKSKKEKEYLLIEYLCGMNNLKNYFDENKFKIFLLDEYPKYISNILSIESYKKYIKIIREKLLNVGVNFQIIKSGLNTTTKGLSRITDQNAFAIVEWNKDIAKELWYMTHELSHIAFPEDSEKLINQKSLRILLNDLAKNIKDISLDKIFESRNKLVKMNINPFIALSTRQYESNYKGIPLEKINKKFTINKKDDKNDLFFS